MKLHLSLISWENFPKKSIFLSKVQKILSGSVDMAAKISRLIVMNIKETFFFEELMK